MKKIISLFCTLAMVLSMAVVAHADENNYVEFKLVSKEGGNAVVEAHLVTNEEISSMAMFWNVSDALNKGATKVTIEKGTCSNATYTAAQKMIMTNYTDASNALTGDVLMATFTFEGITEDFDITLQPFSTRTNTFFKNSAKVDVTSKFTTATQTIKLVEDVVKTADVKDVAVVSEVAPSGKATFGISGVVAGGAAFSKIKFAIADTANNLTADYVWELGTSIDANDVTFGLNIWGAPTNAEITATAVAE